MSTNWPYAHLSKLASEFGGPENLLSIIKSRAFQDGFTEGVRAGKIKMIPVTVVALCLGTLGSTFIPKARDIWKDHQQTKLSPAPETPNEATVAEAILIQKIRESEIDSEQLVENFGDSEEFREIDKMD